MAEIVLKGVSKRFPDGFEAVKDMSLDVADGEFIILVGPSGCGKSTALRMIAGLEDITEGELRIGDQVVNQLAPKDRDIAMVFQNYALYPHMTVRQNMAFPLMLAKAPQEEIDQKVEEAARILDLTQHLDRKPANLSGGQRQRVAMGRAIVRGTGEVSVRREDGEPGYALDPGRAWGGNDGLVAARGALDEASVQVDGGLAERAAEGEAAGRAATRAAAARCVGVEVVS